MDENFPLHVNTVWMSRYNQATEYYHRHDFYEISCVLSGQAECFVNGASFFVGKGDVVIFNCNEIHGWKMEKKDIQLLVVAFSQKLWADSSADQLIKRFQEDNWGFRNVLFSGDVLVDEIFDSICYIKKEWTEMPQDYQLMIKAQMLKLLVILTRSFQMPKPSLQQAKYLRDMKKIEKALEYIEEHYTEQICLEQMAKFSFLSKNYFSSLFHRLTGQKFMDYIISKRLSLAKKLLQQDDAKVVDIALACGFGNLSNFYKQYRRFYRETPRR